MEDSGWTVDTLKEHLEGLIAALKELTEARFLAVEAVTQAQKEAAERALDRAEANIDKRLEKLNELRDVVAANDSRYAERGVVEQRLNALEGFRKFATGGFAVLGVTAITNFIKFWFGS